MLAKFACVESEASVAWGVIATFCTIACLPVGTRRDIRLAPDDPRRRRGVNHAKHHYLQMAGMRRTMWEATPQIGQKQRS